MIKYIILVGLSIVSLSASAQRVKAPAEPQRVKVTSPPEGHDQIVAVPYIPFTCTITKTDGKYASIHDQKELEKADFSTFKEVVFTTMGRDIYLDNELLHKIFNDAVHLEDLEIRNFLLEGLPEISKPNHNLRRLRLSRNKLNTISSSITNLEGLEDFNCDNPIKVLPESFARMKNLKVLSLQNVHFSEMPLSIFSLSQLAELYISGDAKEANKIKELPDLFQQLPALNKIAISDALLSELPKSFSTLKKLESAVFSDNSFTALPDALASNPLLSYVSLSSNPLQWDAFLDSVKKIKWHGLFFLGSTGFSKSQYEEVGKLLPKTDVYYDGMND